MNPWPKPSKNKQKRAARKRKTKTNTKTRGESCGSLNRVLGGNIYCLIIELKGLPKTANGAHGHWIAAAAERKKWRRLVCLQAITKGLPPEPLHSAKLICTRYSSNEPDYDNLAISFKSCIDGLRDAGVIVEDRKANIGRPEYRWEKAARGEGRIKIEVRGA